MNLNENMNKTLTNSTVTEILDSIKCLNPIELLYLLDSDSIYAVNS